MKLTTEEQELVYEHYGVELYSVMCSPLPDRDDNTPSFSTKLYGENVKWSDFGAGLIGKSCIDFVMEMEKLNYKASTDVIRGIIGGAEKVPQKASGEARRNLLTNKLEVIHSTKFEKYELGYWNARGVSEEQLKQSLTFPLRILKVNGKFRGTSIEGNPKFVYYLGGKVGEPFKVYSPYDETFKWVSNRLDLVDYETPPQGKYKDLIILSGRKDNLVFNNYQLEFDTTSSLSESNFSGIIRQLDKDFKHYRNIYSLFDFDDRGIEFSENLSHQSGGKIKPIIFTKILNYFYTINVKDVDNLKTHGDKELEKIFINEIKEQTKE